MSDFQPGGWNVDAEDFEQLAALPNESPILALRGSFQAVTLDPREVIQIPNQQRQGSCVGHALSTCMEWCYAIESGKWDKQLSRAYCYYESQKLCGLAGRDQGSTVSAAVRLSETTGAPEEQFWQYPSSYNNKRPGNWQALLENAAQYRIAKSYKMSSYDGVATFLGSGQGGIVIGIGWNSSVDRAVCESYSGGGGGHALCFPALSSRRDGSGNNYVWMANSWGTSWGNKGWSEISPKAVGQMLAARSTVMVGISDMPQIKPRKVDWIADSPWIWK